MTVSHFGNIWQSEKFESFHLQLRSSVMSTSRPACWECGTQNLGGL